MLCFKISSICSKLSSPAYGYQNSVGSKGNQSILQFPSVVLPPQSVYIIDEEIPCVEATSLDKQKSVSSDPWSRDDFEDFHMPGVNETRDPGMQNSIDDKEDWFVAYCSKLEG